MQNNNRIRALCEHRLHDSYFFINDDIYQHLRFFSDIVTRLLVYPCGSGNEYIRNRRWSDKYFLRGRKMAT